MPYLKIQTSQTVSKDQRDDLLTQASALVAEQLGKPERFVMVAFWDQIPMLFAATDQPAALLELKSIGLPREATAGLSRALCDFIQQHLNIAPDRVYIEFGDSERHMWGWNGATFER